MNAPFVPYPGSDATPRQIAQLAGDYRAAAHLLSARPDASAPMRFTALHAIELYLNAFLILHGLAGTEVRKLQHDVAKRARLASDKGLRLRHRTADHLSAAAGARAYLMTRYAPDGPAAEPVNRLLATLDEVGRKVIAAIASAPLGRHGEEANADLAGDPATSP